MLVTIVHDDTDVVKHQMRILRENLTHVTPTITFKSCCVWEFTDKVFEENQKVLVMLSKRCVSFSKKVFESFKRHTDQQGNSKRKCRLCVVIETEYGNLNEDYFGLNGKENVAAVKDLQESIIWLPKVCAFLFKQKSHRNKLLNCIIPNSETGWNLANPESRGFHRKPT